MVITKRTPPKSLQFKTKQEHAITNSGESSFRVLYYGNASSVPFMWESHPGTPKHATTESSLPPLTPPPAYNFFSQTYKSSNQPTSLRTLFLSPSVKNNPHSSTSDSSISSYDSSLKTTTSLRSLFLDSSSRKGHVGSVNCGEDSGSPRSILCFGGGSRKVNRMKKVKNVLMSIGSHGKTHKIS
ncbi:hypothetical protein CTI12_AA219600 [Artemisia annua]|uniref:Uncharacterized protein n=1 Tax=Artemisia annua TaxID=35608 RepID=A0A2U1NWV9_ARTAN|nr:hypothetical protein CTI12_AA219600 [Artemisia annua]